MRNTLPALLICLAGVILILAPLAAPPLDAQTRESAGYLVLIGLAFMGFGLFDLARSTLRRR